MGYRSPKCVAYQDGCSCPARCDFMGDCMDRPQTVKDNFMTTGLELIQRVEDLKEVVMAHGESLEDRLEDLEVRVRELEGVIERLKDALYYGNRRL